MLCAVLTLVINFALTVLEQKSSLEILFVVGKKKNDGQNGRRQNASGWILMYPLDLKPEKIYQRSHQTMVKSHLREKP